MAASWDMNELYKFYLGRGYDKKTAAQYVAYQYLASPTGSVSTLKEPEKYYSQSQWYDYEAPGYLGAINYQNNPTGDKTVNTLNNFIRDQLKAAKDLGDLQSRFRVKSPGGVNIQPLGLTTQDLINQVSSLYNEKTSAEKKYKTQQDTHPYAQFGLGDPNLRYTVFNITAPSSSSLPRPKQQQLYTSDKYVQYKPAVDYVAKSMQSFGDTLLKKGIKVDKIRIYQEQFRTALEKAVQSKLDSSNLSPFVDQVKALRPIRKP